MLTAPGAKGRPRKKATAFLAITWSVWFLLGTFCAYFTADASKEFFLGILYASGSLGVLLPGFLPFLITAFAVYCIPTGAILLICSTKAFCFGFCVCGVAVAYGQCSWLICLLTMFTDIFSIPILILYWLRIYGSPQRPSWIVNGCFGFVLLVICSIDHCFVAPFVEYLLSI